MGYSGWDIERGLNEGIISSFRDFSSLAFIQCAGSRNFKEKRGLLFSSLLSLCFAYSGKSEIFLSSTNIDFYYMDLQILGKKKRENYGK